MKREKRTTKKERKAAQVSSPVASARGAKPAAQRPHDHTHIHCVACGKHLDPNAFGEPNGPEFYRCQHGSDFAHCAEHAARAKELVDEHDRTGKPVQATPAYH